MIAALLGDADLLGFVVVVTIVAVTPGPDMALVARHAVFGGRACGLAATGGVCSGLVVHAAFATLGVSAVLAASDSAFAILRLAGGFYLVLLGVRAAYWALRNDKTSTQSCANPVRPRAAFREGLYTNVLNPKVAIVFLSLLPSFLAPHGKVWLQGLVFAGVYLGIGLVWLTGWVVLCSSLHARAALTDRTRQLIGGLAGTVLAGFGILVVVEP
ncbi:MAG: LysE family translocator [Acidimicrobiaceae bacterium]|nr:LysE family translocator [Acidimicrobiaceae bacterium]MBT5582175.1 LysE family translocator [Acidimicrobiaceae bacterium]MBT5852121.1 LysE family translocator [Acidimicrobiaceae bacterium]